ncbi:hypothetical protein [Celeribacter sp.]|uniref:hypothetical protein n=1 Tax=Celeribacter sp. TaxID=1890673 RepID=UPI003A936330
MALRIDFGEQSKTKMLRQIMSSVSINHPARAMTLPEVSRPRITALNRITPIMSDASRTVKEIGNLCAHLGLYGSVRRRDSGAGGQLKALNRLSLHMQKEKPHQLLGGVSILLWWFFIAFQRKAKKDP